jgi:predicted nucleic-acid-binding protein
MKITADTNLLVRALTEDHEHQSKAAQAILKKQIWSQFQHQRFVN